MRLDQVSALMDAVLSGTFEDPNVRQLLSGRESVLDEVGLAAKPVMDSDEYRLAILPGQDDAESLEVAAALVREAHGEADIYVTGHAVPESRLRPLRPGTSVGPVGDRRAGTLGCFVQLADGSRAILSNAHVLSAAKPPAVGGLVSQPSEIDGPADPVATVSVVAPMALGVVVPVDAAAAALHEGVKFDPCPLGGHRLGGLGMAFPLDRRVAKVGRTTGSTSGEIFAIDGRLPVIYPWGTVRLTRLLLIDGQSERFTQPGDSGSVVFGVADLLAYGLHVAGGPNGGPSGFGLSYAHPISDVLGFLGASLLLE